MLCWSERSDTVMLPYTDLTDLLSGQIDDSVTKRVIKLGQETLECP